MIDALVIGAGMSGLMAAHVLTRAGRSVTLLDKGRSVGGRLATRRIGESLADHGAQFFTVRDPAFETFVTAWRERGLAYVWAHGWSRSSLDDARRADGHPRYAFKGGMGRLAATLAEGFTADIRVNVQVASVTAGKHGWRVVDTSGAEYKARALVMTPPAPQSLKLLQDGGTSLDCTTHEALSRIDYAPCLCGLILLDKPAQLPEPGAIQRPGHRVSWLADNRRKGVSTQPVLTLQTGPAFSREHFNSSDADIFALLEEEWRPYARGCRVVEAQVKRWQYSLPITGYHERSLAAPTPFPLIFAGDAFGGPRVEGAALSGLDAGQRIVDALR
ncbi:MAG: FAD-dependent oxidoreductase [Chloroflexi bacterium]|nr:MAG: FAD dependent oxidoreductase [Chloroflexi bacterium OLB13]MBV6436712.1 Renalase [Anaerolineae bacterium]MCC6567492.1 FAD-dependent oxidoreductase [Chloroflexota bacterium]MBW7880730.1 FAD-dependent oxidoreductase [Anaerolineae bacterium]MCO6444421.1 FAD-dependent oxidoreductase [Anaerolineae bacterium]